MSARSPQPSTAVAGVTINQHGTHLSAFAGFDHLMAKSMLTHLLTRASERFEGIGRILTAVFANRFQSKDCGWSAANLSWSGDNHISG